MHCNPLEEFPIHVGNLKRLEVFDLYGDHLAGNIHKVVRRNFPDDILTMMRRLYKVEKIIPRDLHLLSTIDGLVSEIKYALGQPQKLWLRRKAHNESS